MPTKAVTGDAILLLKFPGPVQENVEPEMLDAPRKVVDGCKQVMGATVAETDGFAFTLTLTESTAQQPLKDVTVTTYIPGAVTGRIEVEAPLPQAKVWPLPALRKAVSPAQMETSGPR